MGSDTAAMLHALWGQRGRNLRRHFQMVDFFASEQLYCNDWAATLDPGGFEPTHRKFRLSAACRHHSRRKPLKRSITPRGVSKRFLYNHKRKPTDPCRTSMKPQRLEKLPSGEKPGADPQLWRAEPSALTGRGEKEVEKKTKRR